MEIVVTAIPMRHENSEETTYLVECSACGPLGTMNQKQTEMRATVHLMRHGVVVS